MRQCLSPSSCFPISSFSTRTLGSSNSAASLLKPCYPELSAEGAPSYLMAEDESWPADSKREKKCSIPSSSDGGFSRLDFGSGHSATVNGLLFAVSTKAEWKAMSVSWALSSHLGEVREVGGSSKLFFYFPEERCSPLLELHSSVFSLSWVSLDSHIPEPCKWKFHLAKFVGKSV